MTKSFAWNEYVHEDEEHYKDEINFIINDLGNLGRVPINDDSSGKDKGKRKRHDVIMVNDVAIDGEDEDDTD